MPNNQGEENTGKSPERIAFDAKRRERKLMETFQGKILGKLREIGAEEGVDDVRIEESTFGRFRYVYGSETAILQLHIVDGLAQYHTPLLDIKKPWWKKAFLDQALEGHEDMVSYIAPSVAELLAQYADQAAMESFKHSALVKDAGKSLEIDDEYVENDVFGVHDNERELLFIDAVGDFLTELLSPDYIVHFDDGNGDLYRKIRIKPLTNDALQVMKGGGNALEVVVRKIVDSRDELVQYLAGVKGL